jgi:hypothetical protein
MHIWTLHWYAGRASLQLTRVAVLRSFADYNLDHYGSADRNNYNAIISAHDMRETYLAGFKAVATEIQGFMCSVNEVNGTRGVQPSSWQSHGPVPAQLRCFVLARRIKPDAVSLPPAPVRRNSNVRPRRLDQQGDAERAGHGGRCHQ